MIVQPMGNAPKDGTPVLLCISEKWIQGHWHENGQASFWRVVDMDSHGCGCCGCSNDEPTAWAPLPVSTVKPEVLGYTSEGKEIHAIKPGMIATACVITCVGCSKVIRGMGGPKRGALCVSCFTAKNTNEEGVKDE